MASINLKGFLREPLGEASGGNKIRFTHVSTTGEVIAGSVTHYRVALGGEYDINIEYGNVAIETSDLHSRSWQYHGTTTINQDTTATTLPTLLNSFVPPTDDQIILFQDLVKNAIDAQNASEASAVRSETAAQTSINNSILMTASQHDAILAQNEEEYAASGMVHNGKQFVGGDGEVINEGMWIYPDAAFPNTIWMGRDGGNGTSKLDFPQTHIAGAVANIYGMNYGAFPERNLIHLPPAPNGTVIYDSTGDARGTGNANLNLRTEIDPKYGDIASTDNEAVARAFEGGYVRNADFRNGTTNWVSRGGATLSVSNGVLTVEDTNGDAASGAYQVRSLPAGDYQLKCQMRGVTGEARIYCEYASGGGSVVSVATSETEWVDVDVAFTTNGADIRFNLREDGSVVGQTSEFRNLSVASATEEVVTDRVDVPGLEQFDMVIKDDEVFDMVQSQSTTFGDTDVPTVDSIRPDSFFAVYDGQTGIVKGKCVKWSTLTDVQKRKVAEYMKERLWINEDGDLTFTTIRQRSFAGVGNGDWKNVSSIGANTSDENALKYNNTANVKAQGSRDVAPEISGGWDDGIYWSATGQYRPTQTASDDFAIFAAQSHNVDVAYKGRCFFYVLGTVSRLNQGAKVKGVNESGTKKCRLIGTTGNAFWYELPEFSKMTLKDCFIDPAGMPTGSVGYTVDSGYIGAPQGSGRSDGRFYDAIYADGEGGVVDYRLSAYPMESGEEFAKAWEKVKNGTYRGLEKLVWSTINEETPTSASGSTEYMQVADTNKYKLGDVCSMVRASDKAVIVESSPITEVSGGTTIRFGNAPRFDRRAELHYIVVTTKTNTSISGNFTMTTQWGDPAKLLTAFPDGFSGVWGGLTP